MTEKVENKSLDQDAITGCEENPDNSIREVFNLMNNYEALVIEIQDEARKFQEDNRKLRRDLENVVAENVRLRNQVPDDPIAEFRSTYIEVADKIFNNMRNQLMLCYKEKEMYENLWQKTASVLEHEIPKNSMAKIKNEYDMEVRQLKMKLNECHEENKKKTEINATLQKNFKILMKKLECIQTENMELKDSNNQLLEKIKNLEIEKDDTERLLDESNELNKQQMQKSTESFLKMQETIKVAEGAMAEVEQLMEEKRLLEEEHDNLARTIGSVMKEASEKVDKTIEDMRKQHKVEMEYSQIEIERLKQEVEHEKLKTTSAMHQVKMLEEKLHSIEMTNSYLGEDLKVAVKTLADTDKELKKIKSVMSDEKEAKQLCQYEVEKLRAIIENNKKNKEKWKVVIVELTKTLEEKIKNLILENHDLKTSRRTF
ncbi:girdin [Chironomus tepperi]|uniref:girdin n=1 Tax=Chironomus tepperi TaxID=113505 RepID=UPI00391FAB43